MATRDAFRPKLTEEEAANKIKAHYRGYKIRKGTKDYINFQRKKRENAGELLKLKNRIYEREKEFEFVTKLDPVQLALLKYQREHKAAVILQAHWKGRTLRKQFLDIKYERVRSNAIRRIQKLFRMKIRERQARREGLEEYGRLRDTFYDIIPKQRENDLHAQITQRRKVYSESEHYWCTPLELNEKWAADYNNFLGEQREWEIQRRIRRHLFNNNFNMISYLSEKQDLEKMRSYYLKDATMEELKQAKRIHKEKLEAFLAKKSWLRLLKEDDVDYEGERILLDIDNYRNTLHEKDLKEAKRLDTLK